MRLKPTAYVIAGPNGAGKTTFAMEFLPEYFQEFLNADLIAAGLAPFHPLSQNIRAGRLLLERIDELAQQRRDFAIETTLSGRTYVKVLRQLKQVGYRINLIFLWLPSGDLAVARVKYRVLQGGHDVPEDVIRRRYDAGIRNLFGIYRLLFDDWWLYDASGLHPQLIASEVDNQVSIEQRDLYSLISEALNEN